VRPGGRDYLRAKRIKQGKSRIDPVYDAFVERFRRRYGISPLAITLDTFGWPRGQAKTPRLCVVLERTGQYCSFLRSPFKFDEEKQQATAVSLRSHYEARTCGSSSGSHVNSCLPRCVRTRSSSTLMTSSIRQAGNARPGY
jgi:hypothetical protein